MKAQLLLVMMMTMSFERGMDVKLPKGGRRKTHTAQYKERWRRLAWPLCCVLCVGSGWLVGGGAPIVRMGTMGSKQV